MAVLQESTREQLRVAIGRVLGAVRLITAESDGTTTTFKTDDLWGGADDHNGKWWLGTDAPNDGIQARVIDSTVSSNIVTLTLHPAVSSTKLSDTAELWEPWLNPEDVHAAINQAISDATGLIFTPTEDITLHTGGSARFDIPTTFEMLRADGLELRTDMVSRQVIPAGVVWDESVDSDFTITQDTEDLLFGRVPTKIVVAGTASNGDLVSDDISSIDLSNFTHLEFPIKVRVAVAASDLVFRLSATTNGGDTDKIIAIPALTVGTDTWVRVAMDESTSSFDSSEATAIISVALEYNANVQANTIWIGEVIATQNDSYVWTSVDSNLWGIDKSARDLIFKNGLKELAGYRLMKLTGGDVPMQLSTDATVTEVPEDFIVNRAAAYLLESRGGGQTTDVEARSRRAGRFFQLSEQAKGKFPMAVNWRYVT